MTQKNSSAKHANPNPSRKDADLASNITRPEGQALTTDQGLRIEHTDDSLRVGPRGPTLLEDFHFREKLTRFDHERIPERVVHARGSAAHGYFQVYKPLAELTCAKFLNDPSRKTPVFVRFSTVAGARGSADTVRDVRGFATKFYTDEGNFDLVGNNIPVFFIQDGIKFPDVIHAVKPEPHNEMPSAASAHDTFWDFVSLVPESAHMVMWAMSDRAIPRSYRMMEGFGVHTFRLVNERGVGHFVKFHWKPLLGVHSLVWDEAQKIAGFDPDFHRRDLWETLAKGDVAEWELGLQVVKEEDADKFDFDLLDPTKLIPEERVPVQAVGKLTLNRNPDNFFAETEQVAFCVSNLVQGIDVTDDPLMQARLFSYLDTQLTRLGGPNFAELPINRPVAPVCNNQQDGFSRHTINATQANYHPNSVGGGCPVLSTAAQGGYVHFPEHVEGKKQRLRSPSFKDHFSQAAMFLHSLAAPERTHLQKALCFELGKVTRIDVRERMVDVLANIDATLAQQVASTIGVRAPKANKAPASPAPSPALSQLHNPPKTIKSRKVAFLCGPGVDAKSVADMRQPLEAAGAIVEIIGTALGELTPGVQADKALVAAPSVFYDAVYVPAGTQSIVSLKSIRGPSHYIEEAFVHGKTIAAHGEAADFVNDVVSRFASNDGVVLDKAPALAKKTADAFIAAMVKHRHWSREG